MNIFINKTITSRVNNTCTIYFEFFLQKENNSWLEPLYKTECYTCIENQDLNQLNESAKLFAKYLCKLSDHMKELTESEFYILFEKMPEIRSVEDFNYTLMSLRERSKVA
ncbi:hypothetical protein [Flammeovirga sp. SJP92]|uniref:hypothetical protein n=1 Tax=Flammeovirga sp. SJP92 TaxID=1775430 RepID=UPI0007897673|nr:hypothetical protein [Flammeovirga sp. SJP92]KXX69046.1 hypothetical protein AVL50_17985 [Flammeovirga sp. SJP92]